MNHNSTSNHLLKPAVFILALLPLLLLIRKALTMGLGANPIESLLHQCGDWALNFLLITLVITPLQQVTGMNWPQQLRRMMGLYSFFYATLHLMTYVALDQAFVLNDIIEDVLKHKRIIAGMISYLFLIPLAITSTNRMVRRIGARRWFILHRLTYVSAIGGVIHYMLLVKKDLHTPLIYAIILALLLIFRIIIYIAARIVREKGHHNEREP